MEILGHFHSMPSFLITWKNYVQAEQLLELSCREGEEKNPHHSLETSVFLILHLECWPTYEVVCTNTVVFDLVSFSLFTGDRCRPKSGSGDLPSLFIWTGGRASRRQPDVPRVKVGNSLFALTSSIMASVWATLPGGDGLGRPSSTRAMREHQPLILFPRAWLNWSKRERLDAIKSWRNPFGKWAKWARLSSPLTDFHGHPLKGTWERSSAIGNATQRALWECYGQNCAPSRFMCWIPIPQTVTLSADKFVNAIS